MPDAPPRKRRPQLVFFKHPSDREAARFIEVGPSAGPASVPEAGPSNVGLAWEPVAGPSSAGQSARHQIDDAADLHYFEMIGADEDGGFGRPGTPFADTVPNSPSSLDSDPRRFSTLASLAAACTINTTLNSPLTRMARLYNERSNAIDNPIDIFSMKFGSYRHVFLN